MLIRVVFFDKFVAPEATIFALPAILSPGAAAGLVAAPIRSSFSLDWESLRALEGQRAAIRTKSRRADRPTATITQRTCRPISTSGSPPISARLRMQSAKPRPRSGGATTSTCTTSLGTLPSRMVACVPSTPSELRSRCAWPSILLPVRPRWREHVEYNRILECLRRVRHTRLHSKNLPRPQGRRTLRHIDT